MLYKLVERKKQEWLKSADFPLEDIFSYIRKMGKLRKPQIEALETYLFLKTQGDNRPLPELLGSGFFTTEKDFEALAGAEIPPNLYELLKKDTAAMGLYQFAMLNDLQDLQKEMHRNHGQIHFQEVINKLFYEISYADYLMSLPMGAGKTFLIAAIIYLDLYFYNSNPDGNFARNFLVLIPNALKSSIGPSLRNIENFDPTWVLPKEVVAKLQPNLRFEVLDKKKQSKNSMRTNNPNAQKVMHAVHSGFNHVFIVNAEKVILDNYDESRQELPEVNDGVKYERANELRSVLSQLPNLGIFVDEVHHVHTSGNTKEKKEIKLRGVINRWNQEKNHNISYMLGFSGTPYLPQTNSVKISEDLTYKIKNITSTVYHYPLFNAIEGFLKLPEIKTGFNTNRNAETELKRKEIIKFGVDDFLAKFGDKKYAAGAIAKMAIYCPSIEVLEKEVYPLLINKLKIPSQEILRYHKGNKTYTLPPENERHFRSLDMPESPHRFILLVQVGREGWDCRSLTGVILSQEGDCSRNMVLQTCCRCLREVDGGEEKAVIWLSEKNARYLGEQLEKEQDTSIGDISRAQRHGSDKLDTTSRIKYLGLDKISYYKLQVSHQDITIEEDANTNKKLKQLIKEIKDGRHRGYAAIATNKIGKDSRLEQRKVSEAAEVIRGDVAVFSHWLVKLSKDSFGLIKISQLLEHEKQLKQIFSSIILHGESEGRRESARNHPIEIRWNASYELDKIDSRVRLCFHRQRTLKYNEIYDIASIDLFNEDKLKPVTRDQAHIYPSDPETFNIIKLDEKMPRGTPNLHRALETQHKNEILTWAEDMKKGLDKPVPDKIMPMNSLAVASKDRTFHYLPHNFSSSGYEQDFFKELLKSQDLEDLGVEIYYNGNRHLGGFTIECYVRKGVEKQWHRVGNYTTDFLIVKRDSKNKLQKLMMVETKGNIYSHSPDFQDRKQFVDQEFVKQNNKKFSYEKFCFLYLPAEFNVGHNAQEVVKKAKEFFSIVSNKI